MNIIDNKHFLYGVGGILIGGIIGALLFSSNTTKSTTQYAPVDVSKKLAEFGTVTEKLPLKDGGLTAWKVVSKSGSPVVFITTEDGRVVINGNIWSLDSKENITPTLSMFQTSPTEAIATNANQQTSSTEQATTQKTGALSGKYVGEVPESIKTVASLAGFKEGNGDVANTLYIIIDPRCQYCHKAFSLTREYVKRGFSIKWIPTIALGNPTVGEPLASALIHAKNAQEFDDILNQKIKPTVKPNQKDLEDMAKSLDFMFAAFEQNNQGSAGVPVAFFLDQRTKQPKMLMGVSEQPILDEIFGRL